MGIRSQSRKRNFNTEPATGSGDRTVLFPFNFLFSKWFPHQNYITFLGAPSPSHTPLCFAPLQFTIWQILDYLYSWCSSLPWRCPAGPSMVSFESNHKQTTFITQNTGYLLALEKNYFCLASSISKRVPQNNLTQWKRFWLSDKHFKGTGKGKAVPLQAWSGPEGSRKLRFPDFMTTVQDGGVRLTHRPPLSPGNTPGTHFC